VSGIDLDMVAGTVLEVKMAIDWDMNRVDADNSGGVAAADWERVVVVNSAAVRQDVVVVVSSDVALEIALDVPVQIILDSDRMMAIVVATMDSMVTMRDTGYVVVVSSVRVGLGVVSMVVSRRPMDGLSL
jgi:hypothetical protein